MHPAVDVIENALPLAYAGLSAAIILYLSRKPVQLDDQDDFQEHDEHLESVSEIDQELDLNACLSNEHGPKEGGGALFAIDLTRFGLTVLQLGLAFFVLVLTFSIDNGHGDGEEDNDDRRSYRFKIAGEIVQIVSWSYMLILSMIHLFHRRISLQFWIRPQMDIFYSLEWILSSIKVSGVFTFLMDFPVSKWPVLVQIELVKWLLLVFLLWTTLATKPLPEPAPKNYKDPAVTADRPGANEYGSSLYAQLTFAWVNPLIYLGFKRPVQDKDLPWLEVQDQAWWSTRYFLSKRTKKNTFIHALISAIGYDVFIQFLWGVPWCLFMTASPYCLNKIVQYVECENCGPPTWKEYIWVFALFGAKVIESLSMQTALHRGRRMYLHVTAICNSLIFRKTLRRKDVGSPNKSKDEKSGVKEESADDDDNDSDGVENKDGTLNIANLVAVDLKKMEECICYLFYIYGFPLQFIVAAFQLYYLLGKAALIGMVFLVVTIPLPTCFYSIIMKLLKDVMTTKDERMEILNEMLSAIRIVKFFGWESKFVEKIRAARVKELKQTRKSYVNILLAEAAWMVMPIMNTIVVFFSYTKIYNQTMSASVIFTTLALMNIMRTAMNFFPQEVITFLRTIVALRRINQFLDEEEIDRDTTVTKITNGKSKAIVGELERLEGAMFLPRLDYGEYQVSGRGSGSPLDQDRYDAVLEGCALTPDLETFDAGDETEIGEQGITLSGGQKQRVALARALYSDGTVLLLDDCLSAVDSHTGKQLFQTLTGSLVEGRTVIMLTHQAQLTLNAAHYVLVLNKGEVVGSGIPEEAIAKGWIDNVILTNSISDEESEVTTLNVANIPKKAKVDKPKKAATKLTEDEKKAEGSVAWRVYKTYLVASGGFPFWTFILSLYGLRIAVDVSQSAWLAIWANKLAEAVGSFVRQSFNGVVPAAVTQTLYSSFSPRQNGAGMAGELSSKFFGSHTSNSLLTSSGDGSADYYLGIYVLIGLFTMGFVTYTDVVIVISFSTPTFLFMAVFIVAIYAVIGSLYVPISRDLKRLNSNSRSPILNHFNETLTGLATIRAFGFEKRFQSRNLVTVDNNNRTFFLLWSTNRWLHWRVDATGAFVSFSTGMLILRNWGQVAPGWAALSLTFALTFTGNIVWLIRIYAENEMNMNAVERVAEYLDLEEEPPAIIEGSRPPASWPHSGAIAVENLSMRYSADSPEVIKNISFSIKAGEKVGVVGRTGSGKSTFAISLFRFMDPVNGTICIDGIDICKIGLQDLRSKLTIIPQDPVLFKGTLRSNLDPFDECEDPELWEALRRSHLIPDPKSGSALPSKRPSFELTSDAAAAAPAVTATLSTAKATPAGSVKGSTTESEIVDPSKITLDTPVKENGSNFSQGQRQLIALARALVRQSKIIVMDEATASVDFETDLKIQATIREEMADSTIITIAHRIRTIADFDRVLVMHAGEIAEYDTPFALMNREDGLFRSMCERSSEFDILYTIAEEKDRKDRELSHV
ncbi:hypothetical protein EMPS_10207 [Entomortierella parvispora]|uniref:Uncharacterized protein n=1 Tax=Entomortierella parvispora TaxID=205924 RepID=A0A9P3HJV0_9FUNG|nr:hypothetical protein EMPS_10207 [Entomortierella parvispora]